jgi:ubiquinone/menaquinone biosynthesis C-methylase UbiE
MTAVVSTWTEWLSKSRFSYMNDIQKQQTFLWLFNVRDKILDRAKIKEGDTIIDIGAGSGLLSFGAYERLNGKARFIISDAFQDCVDECRRVAKECGIEDTMEFMLIDASKINLPENSVDVIVMRSVLVHILEKSRVISEFYKILKENGRVSIFEPILRRNTKYYELINPDNFPNYKKIKEIELKIMQDNNDSLVNFDEETLEKDFQNAGFKNIDIRMSVETSSYEVYSNMIDPWFNMPPSPNKPTVKEKFMEFMPEKEVNNFIEMLKDELEGQTITLHSPVVFIYAEK